MMKTLWTSKKLWTSMLICLIVLGFGVATTSAASPAKTDAEPFTGTFEGLIYGDKNSSAVMTLELEQDGNEVTGTAYLSDGLYVNAGNCGSANIPAVTQAATGTVSTKNPNLLATEATFNVSGINVTIDLVGELVDDELEADAKIDLPWLCGKDPVLSGTLEKAS